MYALHLSGFSVNLFLSADQRFLVLGVIFVVGMVKFVHLVRYSMRIVPNKFLGLVKFFRFKYLFLHWVGGMRKNGIEIVLFDG
jgi:hypothetical protein